jgi:hypothetical protein
MGEGGVGRNEERKKCRYRRDGVIVQEFNTCCSPVDGQVPPLVRSREKV